MTIDEEDEDQTKRKTNDSGELFESILSSRSSEVEKSVTYD